VAWDKLAENCAQYLTKGKEAYVEGPSRTRSYDDKEGNKRYITEIVAQKVQFLGGAPTEARDSHENTDSPFA
jgi:single-strand DNA-binding protein